MTASAIGRKKVAFLHIPKCAGSSLHSIISDYFEDHEICPDRFRDLDFKPASHFEKYRFFSGHFTAQALGKVPGDKFTFTVLRNPSDRIVSLYYFWRRHSEDIIEAENLEGGRIARNSRNLKEFLSLDNPVPRNHIKNEMARALAGHIFTEKDDKYYEIQDGRKVYVEKFEILERAMATLGQLDCILFVSNIEKDFKNLCKLIDINPAPDLPKVNTRTEIRPNLELIEEEILDREHMALLNKNTELDRIIYQAANVRRNDLFKNVFIR